MDEQIITYTYDAVNHKSIINFDGDVPDMMEFHMHWEELLRVIMSDYEDKEYRNKFRELFYTRLNTTAVWNTIPSDFIKFIPAEKISYDDGIVRMIETTGTLVSLLNYNELFEALEIEENRLLKTQASQIVVKHNLTTSQYEITTDIGSSPVPNQLANCLIRSVVAGFEHIREQYNEFVAIDFKKGFYTLINSSSVFNVEEDVEFFNKHFKLYTELGGKVYYTLAFGKQQVVLVEDREEVLE